MEVAAIFAIIEKAMAVISTGVSIGTSIAPAIKVVQDLIFKQKSNAVTPDDLTAAEAVLDKLIEDFNAPIA